MKNYYTHHNGERPFKVAIADNNNVKIYKCIGYDNNSDEYKYSENPILTFIPLKIFVGNSPKNKMTIFSGGHGKKFYGNSILLHIKGLKYVFVGSVIYQMSALYPIKKFVSPVGNNDVPYPYAIDEKDNFYLMIENVIISNLPKGEINDPYGYYYGLAQITKNHSQPFRNVKILQKKLQ